MIYAPEEPVSHYIKADEKTGSSKERADHAKKEHGIFSLSHAEYGENYLQAVPEWMELCPGTAGLGM